MCDGLYPRISMEASPDYQRLNFPCFKDRAGNGRAAYSADEQAFVYHSQGKHRTGVKMKRFIKQRNILCEMLKNNCAISRMFRAVLLQFCCTCWRMSDVQGNKSEIQIHIFDENHAG